MLFVWTGWGLSSIANSFAWNDWDMMVSDGVPRFKPSLL